MRTKEEIAAIDKKMFGCSGENILAAMNDTMGRLMGPEMFAMSILSDAQAKRRSEAAAPSMLAALKLALPRINVVDVLNPKADTEREAVIAAIRNAEAK